MFYEIFKFELRGRMKRFSTYIFFGIFFLVSFLTIITLGGAFKGATVSVDGGGQGAVLANAPYILHILISIIGLFGIMNVAGMMGNAAYKDFEQKTFGLYFSYPIKKYAYIWGRFLATLVVLLFVFSSIALGAAFASVMPFVMSEKFGSNPMIVYIMPYLTAIIPNLLFTGAIFYSLALKVRKRLPVYMTSIGILMGYFLSNSLIGDIKNRFIAAIIDPFGINSAQLMTRYWTSSEKNTKLVLLSGDFLLNRIIWVSIGLIILWLGTRKFKLAYFSSETKSKHTGSTPTQTLEIIPMITSAAIPKVERRFSFSLYLKQFIVLAKNEFLSIVKNVYFFAILGFGMLFVLMTGFSSLGIIEGTSVFPVTYMVTAITGGVFTLFGVIIMIFYSGEMVWRERDKKFAQIFDALPVPGGLIYCSRITAIMLAMVLLSISTMLCGIIIQVFKGYFNFEIGLYFSELFGFQLWEYFLFAVFAMFIHVLVNNKYLAHFIVILYAFAIDIIPAFGLEHKLFVFPNTPNYIYSDMNGYGHFLLGVVSFRIYWTAFAVLLAVVSYLFWVRGGDVSFKLRFKKAVKQFSRGPRLVTAAALLVFIFTGGFIFYNTNILNKYRTNFEFRDLAASYEKKYKQYEGIPQPRITDMKANVDIYPDEKRATLDGYYILKNKTEKTIPVVHVTISPDVKINAISLDKPAKLGMQDKEMGYFIYNLSQPMNPGETLSLRFNVTFQQKGFKNNGVDTRIVDNGTFFNNRDFMPGIGYNTDNELNDNDTRKKHGLKPKERIAKVDDLKARMNTYISSDSDWVTFESTVSTSKDQIAIAPGYLQKDWIQGSRHYFHYKLDQKILNFFSFISAKYEIKRDKWKDVAIEIYYDKKHPYNVDRMILSIKKSLDYYTTNFGPYQHRLVRILEFPRFATFAQSFPTTIPYSEGIGFIARIGEGDVDYPFWVTAHEVAHQWWAHQVIGGNVQGATLMSEVLSQYSSLMVEKKNFDDKIIRQFLAYETDNYFRGRARETKKEVPLMLGENQGYLHYNKGIVVMNALQDYIGEENVNKALAKYLKDKAYQEPPYTNSIEFLAYLREVTPDHLKYIITDLFETITLHENRAIDAFYTKLKNGKYKVKLQVQGQKLRADDHGIEKEIPIADYIDIGILDKNGNAFYLKKELIRPGVNTFEIETNKEPVKAGIDPYHKLLERKTEDNVIDVKKK